MVQKFPLTSTPVLPLAPWLCLWMVLLKQDQRFAGGEEPVFVTSPVETRRDTALVLPQLSW